MPTADELLGPAEARELIAALSRVDPSISLSATRLAAERLSTLTLSARARSLAEGVMTDIGGDYTRMAGVVKALHEDPDSRGWKLWPVGLALATTAIDRGTTGAFDESMGLLGDLTHRFTSEFAVRPLLRHDLPRALSVMTQWTTAPDWQVRRLASEGSRPLLPWAARLPEVMADPALTRPVLDALYDDPREEVRRSVANHVNDHSRSDPDTAVDIALGWQRGGGTHVASTTRHALRTVLKDGDARALEILGYPPIELLVAPLEVELSAATTGPTVHFRTAVDNRADGRASLLLSYVLHFPDARGGERVKVFSLGRKRVDAGGRSIVRGSHDFRNRSTRRYYPGRYAIALRINAQTYPRATFAL
ncbi:DNA alkylation repair protein [Dietzia sp. SLG310A2-38A2]|uniref:DNA alkylation repair protein n=1 Tax=Dietzia sp. SLG310A2-38A2 TaxID=1630643 RepID=UPI0015FC8D5B|nr:DNA alkylation repair protein [Dietzia sp. SLG310A2-38A2]MBB1031328.1 DNA alkylation repair protein [Dietzia sp. SLG310A2-38A2]